MTPEDIVALSRLNPAELRQKLADDAGQTAKWLYEAACQGLVEAQTALAQMLLDGRGTPANAAAAQRWFAVAAQAGHVPAMNMLGRCLERGWGGELDMAQAALWYGRAADAGLDWAQYNLANMVLRGRGVPRDPVLALTWFYRAADQGHAKSMNLVGRFLEEGWVGPVDARAAVLWYRRSAEGGDFRGRYNLGTLLAGAGRLDEAVQCFKQATVEGSQDFRRLAAEQLLVRAEPELRQAGLDAAALCCEGGDGSDFHRYGMALATADDPKPAVALAWLARAVAAGHLAAEEDLQQVQADYGRRRARRWFRRVRPRRRSRGTGPAAS
jgi:TPR repeat protein